MSDYRFHLEKYRHGSKLACPACKKPRCFVRYVDDEGVIKFPDTVGRCDHEDRCGYHYTPKDFFHDYPDMKPKDWDDSTTPILYKRYTSTVGRQKPTPEPDVPSFIPPKTVELSLAGYNINPLYLYLCGVIGKEETTRIFKMYKVGTGRKWNGCTVFWQTDINNQVRAGKLMGYNASNGHRIKEPQPQVTWAHSELKLSDFHLVQCLFGEHLLPLRPVAPVGLVESEKTALIMAHFVPDFIWLATGGKNGCFNETALQVLRNRDVTLFPDLGATEKWREKVPMLLPICLNVRVSDLLESFATDEHREQGLDVADFFLMKPTKHEILADMIRRNPCVQTLIDKFKLEICENTEEESRLPYRGLRW